MKVLFAAGREPGYVRNAMLLACLKRLGAEIDDCSDSSPSYPRRLLRVFRNLLLRRGREYDLVFVGFFGQPLAPLVRRLVRGPMVLDAFLSAYDTMCFDRRRFAPHSPAGRFFFHLDRLACSSADRVLLDTDAHIDYFVDTFGLPRDRFRRVLVGADESVFYPRETTGAGGRFRVFYYSSFLPLHGTDVVVQAAARLRGEPDVEFVVVGTGPESSRVRRLAAELGTTNVRFVDWLPFADLPLEISLADVCLGGHFSDRDKAGRVIAGKTFQFLAMGKPVIVGDCRGSRELLTDGMDALFVAPQDPEALAKGIRLLRGDPELRERIAAAGYRTFLDRGSTSAVQMELREALKGLPGWDEGSG